MKKPKQWPKGQTSFLVPCTAADVASLNTQDRVSSGPSLAEAAVTVCLAPAAEFWSVPGQGVVAQFASGLSYFPGAVAQRCATLLQEGQWPPDTLFTALTRDFAPQVVFECLNQMRDAGLLTNTDDQEWCDPLTVDDLHHAGLNVWPDRGAVLGPAVFFSSLADCAGPMAPPAGKWLPVSSTPEQITVGPMFRGLASDPCPSCLASRAADHDDLGQFLGSVAGAVQVKPRKTDAGHLTDQIAFVQTAIHMLEDLPADAILVRHSKNGATEQARATSRGGCKVCQSPPRRVDTCNAHVTLQSGGYRPLQASDVLAQLRDCVDPVTGIVRQLTKPKVHSAVQGLSKVTVARHAFPLAVPDILAVIRNRRGRSAGKGRTDDDAKVGAIAEALERYAGVARPDDPTYLARRSELDGTVITASEWSLYSDVQLDSAARWQALDAPAAWVPDRFDSDTKMEWTQVSSLTGNRTAWAPAALCWHQYPEQTVIPGRADSNGCAAGQTLTDARLQGLLELIERDAVGIWWWTRSRRPEIDVNSLNDPWFNDVVQHLGIMGYSLALQDLTHDLNVPVVAAIGWPKGDSGPLLLGFGAHPSPQVAASRAMTEIMQVLPDRHVADIGGDPRHGLGLVPGHQLNGASLRDDLGFLYPEGSGTDRFGLMSAAPETADDALSTLLDQMQALGLKVWTLDQSRPDVPLAVVRMIVPGLRHFRPRFAPGRLFSVPDRLGWKPRSPDLNRLFIRQ